MSCAVLEQLAKADVLSLDVFDTLLGRRCAAPEDVFHMMEAELCVRHGDALAGFAAARAGVDSRARRRAWDQHQREEITLQEIYTVLLEDHPGWGLTVADLMELEQAHERSQLYPLERGLEWIRAARAVGKQVIFVSDMYLAEDFCRRALQENGYTDYDRLYLSSTVGKLKHTGNLFAHVVADLGIQPDKILHVGDNPHSDGKQARKHGLRSVVVPKTAELLGRVEAHPLAALRGKPHRSAAESALLGLLARGCLREDAFEDPFWYRMGYQFGGPLLLGYVRFIMSRLRGRGIEKVYFLSRDGFILKQVYDLLSAGHPAGELPESCYLYASRRALNFAAITAIDPATENWLAEGIRLTVADFLQRIHIDPQQHLEAIRSCGFTGPEHAVVGGHEYTNLRQLYHVLEGPIVDAAATERAAYIDYLKSNGVTEQSPLVLVDVGWMTSIQHSFSRLLESAFPQLKVEGFYIGSYPEARQRSSERSRHHHYLMEYGQPAEAMRIIRHCVCLLEFFFAAPEKTFLRIERAADGTLRPVCADKHENERDLPALAQIHDGILEFVREAHALAPRCSFEIAPEWPLALLQRLLGNPTAEEAERLGELQYADGYGAYFHHTCMARPSGWRALGLSKRDWKREFKATHWPMGYYKRLGPLEQWLFRRLHPHARFDKPYG